MERFTRRSVVFATTILFATTACDAMDEPGAGEAQLGEAPGAGQSVGGQGGSTPLMTARFVAEEGGDLQLGGMLEVHRGRLQAEGPRTTGGTESVRTGDRQAGGADARATGGRETGEASGVDGLSGTAPANPTGLTAEAGFTVVAIMQGLPDAEHAWHIHSGTCDTQAPVVAPFTAIGDEQGLSGPLQANEGGAAADTAFVPDSILSIDALQAAPHSVRVHQRGGADPGPVIACANLGQRVSGPGEAGTSATSGTEAPPAPER